VLADERIRRFHAGVIKVLYPKAVVRLHELRIAGEAAAAYYGFQDKGRAYAYLSGFDPRFALESPGSLLLAHVIADSIGAGAREFHFLRGSEAYNMLGAHTIAAIVAVSSSALLLSPMSSERRCPALTDVPAALRDVLTRLER